MDANWIITCFGVADDLMQELGHQTHYHPKVSDAEIITIALVAAKSFNNNHKLTLSVLTQTHYLSGSLDPSRFNRRWHALADWFELIFESLVALFRIGHAFVIELIVYPCQCPNGPDAGVVASYEDASIAATVPPKPKSSLAIGSILLVLLKECQSVSACCRPVCTT